MKKKVIIAMSGGIDSSLAAFLLKEAGFDVLGLFMKLDGLKSSSKSEERAKIVSKKIGIPFRTLDLRKEFKKKVVNSFLEGYKKGITPNPCVICNKEIKFNFLFQELKKRKADFIATGHYVRIRDNLLVRGADKNKDQSYFLWQLKPSLLRNILFPLGGYKKEETKGMAKEFGFSFSDVPESQEICFIETTTEDFLEKNLKINPGKIIDKKGNVLGKHNGLWFYTIGQRKGIKLSGGPYWVIDKDKKNNILIVSKNDEDLYKKKLIAKNVNWFLDRFPEFLKVQAQPRYQHKPISATLINQGQKKVKVIFSKPERAITPGQSIVFYQGNKLFGGAFIDKVL